MKPELVEYDPKNKIQALAIADILPLFHPALFPRLKVLFHSITGEYIILNFEDAPSIVWIEYLNVYKTYEKFMFLVEALLKELKIQSVRQVFTPDFYVHKSIAVRISNTLIKSGFYVFELCLKQNSMLVCFQKVLSKRSTASTTVLSSIKEDD